LAKLVRFDEKDLNFAVALVGAGLIDLGILERRATTIPTHPLVIERIQSWISGMRRAS
jgi:hypothetical protein